MTIMQPSISNGHREAMDITQYIAFATKQLGEFAYILLRDVHQYVEAHPQFVSTMIPLPKSRLPMTDEESRIFGCMIVPFGEFKGRRTDDVPFDRLCWYADQNWTDELRRYLKSPRILRESETTP